MLTWVGGFFFRLSAVLTGHDLTVKVIHGRIVYKQHMLFSFQKQF